MNVVGQDTDIAQAFDLTTATTGTIAIVAGVVAVAVVLFRRTWRLARGVVTIVHEAGHAVVAVLAGRRLRSIRLHSDTSGVTVSRGKRTGPGMVLTTIAGYPAPSMLGLAFAGLVSAEQLGAVLGIAAALLLGVLVMVRNGYGIFAVVVSAAVLAGVGLLAGPGLQAVFVYVLTWFLLLGGIRPVIELHAKRRHGAARDSDADQLARLTGVPATIWLLVLGVLTVTCLVVGGMLLAEPALAPR